MLASARKMTAEGGRMRASAPTGEPCHQLVSALYHFPWLRARKWGWKFVNGRLQLRCIAHYFLRGSSTALVSTNAPRAQSPAPVRPVTSAIRPIRGLAGIISTL